MKDIQPCAICDLYAQYLILLFRAFMLRILLKSRNEFLSFVNLSKLASWGPIQLFTNGTPMWDLADYYDVGDYDDCDDGNDYDSDNDDDYNNEDGNNRQVDRDQRTN